MINTRDFFDHLKTEKINFFTGVPDSLLKDFCSYLFDNVNDENHIIAANEGSSIALAVGNYLSTGNIPLVYMQNSGFGNTVNPLMSLADDMVYGIPMVLMIGWRGEPGLKDEPQHLRQGMISEDILKSMKIPYRVLDKDSDFKKIISDSVKISKRKSKPFALLVKKNSFEKYELKNKISTNFQMNREDVINCLIKSFKDKDIIISTTGKTSRELFECRVKNKMSHKKDFLTVGSMGHTSSIALGIALVKKDRNVYCIDGDGSVIMHMGNLSSIANFPKLHNFRHIVINNGAHDSVGGQPTVGFKIDFCKIAKSCGYKYVKSVKTKSKLDIELAKISNIKSTVFLEVCVNKGSRPDLGRPTNSPTINKKLFTDFLNE